MSDTDPYGQQPTAQPPPYGEPPPSPYAGQQPAPYGQPYGQQPTPYGTQPAGPEPAGTQPYAAAYPGGASPDKRPGTVTAAAITTIVTSGLVLLCGVLLVVVGLSDLGEFYDNFREGAGGTYDNFSDDEIGTILVVIGAVMTVWCAVAMLLGVLVMRRSSAARILLVISAAVAVLFSLVGILSIVSVVPLLAAIAVIVLLFVGSANDWFARRGRTVEAQPAKPWG